MKAAPSPVETSRKGTTAYVPRLWPLDTSITEVRSRLSRMRVYRDYAAERGLNHMVVTPEFIEQRLVEADVPKKQWAPLIRMVVPGVGLLHLEQTRSEKGVTAEDVDSEPEAEDDDLPVTPEVSQSVTVTPPSKSLKKPSVN